MNRSETKAKKKTFIKEIYMSDVKMGVLGLEDLGAGSKPTSFVTFSAQKGALVYADKASKESYKRVNSRMEENGIKLTQTTRWSPELGKAFQKALQEVEGAPHYIGGIRGTYLGLEHVVRTATREDGVEVNIDQVVLHLDAGDKNILLQFPTDSEIGTMAVAAALTGMKKGEVYTIKAYNKPSSFQGKDYVNTNFIVEDEEKNFVNKYDVTREITTAARSAAKAAYEAQMNSPMKMAEDKKKAIAGSAAKGARANFVAELIASHASAMINNEPPAHHTEPVGGEHEFEEDIPF
jgi:hypothetical protein